MTRDVNATRKYLWIASVMLILGSAIVVWGGAMMPFEEDVPPDAVPGKALHAVAGRSTSPDKSSSALPLAAFEPLFAIPFRQALYDEPADPPPEPVSQPVAPPPDIQLVGTAIETNEAIALIRGKDNTIKLCRVGDDIDGLRVVGIQLDQVRIKHGTNELTLQMAASDDKPIRRVRPVRIRERRHVPDDIRPDD